MAEQIDSLFVRLGLETDQQEFQQAESQFDALQSKVLQFGAVIGAGFGIESLTFGIAESVNEANKLAQEFEGLGVTPQFIDNLRGAFELIDEDGREAESTIRNIAGLIEDTDWGELSDRAFARGLDISGLQEAETAAQALAELNEQLSGMEDQERARRLADALGLSSAQFRMLREFDVGAQMGRAAGFSPVSGDLSQSAADFTKGWNELQQSMEGLQNAISETFIGDLGEGMSDLAEAIRENREEIAEFADAATPYLKNMAGALGGLLAINVARSSLGIFKNIPFLTGAAAAGYTFLSENASDPDELRGRMESGESAVRDQQTRFQRMQQMPDDLTFRQQQRWLQGGPETRQEIRYEISVDARNSTNPAETEAAVRRAVDDGLREASEATVEDTRSDVE